MLGAEGLAVMIDEDKEAVPGMRVVTMAHARVEHDEKVRTKSSQGSWRSL